MNDIDRQNAEKSFKGCSEEFLALLDLELNIFHASKSDLARAEELTLRTNQLNSTGYTYSYEKLEQLVQSKDHMLLMASLKDKYGDYGKVGLALIECKKGSWIIKLLLMSCRVMSRGIGSVILNYIMNLAKAKNIQLFADFVHNERNRVMYVTYKFAGFVEVSSNGNVILFYNDLKSILEFPHYIKLKTKIENKFL